MAFIAVASNGGVKQVCNRIRVTPESRPLRVCTRSAISDMGHQNRTEFDYDRVMIRETRRQLDNLESRQNDHSISYVWLNNFQPKI